MGAKFEVEFKKNPEDNAVIDHLVAGADYVANTFIILGARLAYGQSSAKIGEKVSLFTGGVVEVKKKIADVIAEGTKLFWDDTAKELTITGPADAYAGLAASAILGVAGFVLLGLNEVQGS